jgi:hypothetical protein
LAGSDVNDFLSNPMAESILDPRQALTLNIGTIGYYFLTTYGYMLIFIGLILLLCLVGSLAVIKEGHEQMKNKVYDDFNPQNLVIKK